MVTNPNIDWYCAASNRKGTTPRCPFATIRRCPRYFQSLSLLGATGTNAAIDPKLERRLLRRWQRTDFWPRVGEQETSVWGGQGSPRSYLRFCPEVTYDNFGYFADSLHEFQDETDRESATRRLRADRIAMSDWRWHFMSLNPIHFTECPLYSLLQTFQAQHEDVLEVKPNFYGVGLNLNALYRRLMGHHRQPKA